MHDKTPVADLTRALMTMVLGPAPADAVGKKCYPRAGSRLTRPGKIIGFRRCQMEGCGAYRIIVRWPKGNRTMPCLKSCIRRRDGHYRIR